MADSASKDRAAKRSGRGGPGGGDEPKQKRAGSLGVDAGGGGGSSAPATAPASASRAHPGSAAASLVDVTVEDADALDCGVCFLPLKPPIFQCNVGHVVCSLCRDKLQATGKCHVCGVATGNYRRCHAMEQLVESIRVPCLYAAHGCALRAAYYDQESHRLVCEHAPCHCPGEACSFVGSTAALLDHVSTAHKWPCITTVKTNDGGYFNVHLHDGFNLILADCSIGNKNKGSTSSVQCLLLLTVERQQLARFISVHWIDPHAAGTSGSQGPTSKEMECQLWYSANFELIRCSTWLIHHYQSWKFRVARTNLSNGLPKPDDCFQVVVPNSVVGDGTGIQIGVRIDIN
ncbi:uncharacterized protein [Miscanthus floridulus]|uniref:uncharacterized protein n=1 Tax=Miscanthus floridulus TaxID=154761 RepID=UPI00345A23B4